MRKLGKKFLVLSAVVATAVSNAAAAVEVPTPDYTDFEKVVGVALAVSLVVMLARRAKGFFR